MYTSKISLTTTLEDFPAYLFVSLGFDGVFQAGGMKFEIESQFGHRPHFRLHVFKDDDGSLVTRLSAAFPGKLKSKHTYIFI